MKEFLALAMFAALGIAFYAVMAALTYVYEGFGLHPALAAVLAAFAGLAGGLAAALLDKIE